MRFYKNILINLLCFIIFPFLLIDTSTAETNKHAPIFKVRDIEGKQVSMEELFHKGPIIVDFWATWCNPCKAELKALAKLYKKYKAQGLEVVAISEDNVEESAKVKQFVKMKKMPFIVIIDRNKELMEKFHAATVPSLFLIAKHGRIYSIHIGYLPGDEKKLEQELLALIRNKE
ncbi:MAG: TlpA disulfide reductase family protein [Elusimicrobiota bacterium]